MRIASTQYQTTMNTALQLASSRVSRLTEQMASGKRLMLPSDDPLTGVRLSRLTHEESALSQYRDNISAVKSRMQQSEGLLSGMSDDLLQAHDLLVAAADGSHAGDDLAALATPLQALRDSLYFAINSKDQEGRYVFSGTASTTPAVSFDPNAAAGARYTVSGNDEEQRVVVASGVTQAANVTVPELADLLNQLDAALDGMTAPGADSNDPALHTTIANALTGSESTMNAVAAKTAVLGGAQNILATLDTNHANLSLSNQQALIDLGQLDYGDAAMQLSSYTLALQATQKAYAKVSGLSLFNQL